MTCDAQSLMNAAACFRCIPRPFKASVALYLWCRIVAKGLPKR